MVIEQYTELWEGCMLPVDKPTGWTSFDVVNKLRYRLKLPGRKVRVGHAGTLDPLATGLLIICTGSFTKRIDAIQGLEKEYTGTIRLGETRPSYDLETEVDAVFDLSGITEARILEAAASFEGDIFQHPPAHSAVKVDGQRAYKLARKGREVALRERKVHISEFRITSIDLPDVAFLVRCSKGTYIRSLAHDLGRHLDSGACLASLRRTAIGPHRVEEAWPVDQLAAEIDSYRPAYLKLLEEKQGPGT